jgi:hypothetical protein
VLHQATLDPPLREILHTWLPGRPWAGGATRFRPLGSFRLDDPAGQVGIETFLLRAGDRLLQVPLTYRGRPLPGADAHLVATAEHSVLGPRWLYDGCGDPVWAAALAGTVLTGGRQADLRLLADGGLRAVRPSVTVTGSGRPGTAVAAVGTAVPHDDAGLTTVDAGPYQLVLARLVGTEPDAPARLSAQWEGGAGVLAGVRVLSAAAPAAAR